MEPSELCAVWGCLHYGSIVATSTSEGRVSFDVLCRYMAEAFGHSEERVFRVTVSEPDAWEPWSVVKASASRRASRTSPPTRPTCCRGGGRLPGGRDYDPATDMLSPKRHTGRYPGDAGRDEGRTG